MYQSVTVVGRLGREPESKVLPSGDSVTLFSMATDRSYNKGGERVKETTWFRVTVFGKQADIANQYLSKGKLVLVEGRLAVDASTGGPRVYQGRDGSSRASFELVANDIRFLSPREEAPAQADAGDIPF